MDTAEWRVERIVRARGKGNIYIAECNSYMRRMLELESWSRWIFWRSRFRRGNQTISLPRCSGVIANKVMRLLEKMQDDGQLLQFKQSGDICDAVNHRCIKPLLSSLLLLLLLLLFPLAVIHKRLPSGINESRTLPISPISLITDTLIRFPLAIISHRRYRCIKGSGSPLIFSALLIGEEVDTEGTHHGGPIDTNVVGCGGEFEAFEVFAVGPFSDGLSLAELIAE